MNRYTAATITVAAIIIAAVLATTTLAAQQQPRSTWTRNCAHLACVNKRLNQLDQRLTVAEGQIASLRKRNRTLRSCIAEFPVTRYYGDSGYYGSDSNGDGNFDQNIYIGSFRYFDQTNVGDGVDHWFLHDSCTSPAFGRPPAP